MASLSICAGRVFQPPTDAAFARAKQKPEDSPDALS